MTGGVPADRARVLPWPRKGVLAVALCLFVAVGALRFSVQGSGLAISTLYLMPISLLAMELGVRGGVIGAAGASALTVAWVLVLDVELGAGEVVLRCGLLTLIGICFGLLGDRLSQSAFDRATSAEQTILIEGLKVHGLVRLDHAGRITRWTRGATEILGYGAREAQSQPLALIFEGEQAAEAIAQEVLDGAVRRGLWDEERWVIAKDGQRRWAAVSVTPLAEGGDGGFALVLRDLTDAKAARHESTRMWEVSFEMLATLRFDGFFQRVNPHWEEVLGWSVDELLARPTLELVHPDDRERTAAEADRLARGGHETVCFENRYRCRDGSYRWLLWNNRASPDDDLIYAAARDITGRKRQEVALAAKEAQLRSLAGELEASVERRTAELAAANKELEAFSYSIAHALGAPLRAIDGYSHAVLEDCQEQLPADARADLARVRESSQRMSTLIDELLGLSRITRRELEREPVDLSGLAEEIAANLRLQERARDVRIDIQPGLRVVGDPELLRLVMQNLFENAWKFTAQTESAHVELARLGSANGHCTFAVRDNGAGFDMRYADKLFRPFERLHRHEEFSGTGVGLTTVARVIDRHGGRIWADGKPGSGASFFFDLPTGREQHDERQT